jgi:hypothetical protein
VAGGLLPTGCEDAVGVTPAAGLDDPGKEHALTSSPSSAMSTINCATSHILFRYCCSMHSSLKYGCVDIAVYYAPYNPFANNLLLSSIYSIVFPHLHCCEQSNSGKVRLATAYTYYSQGRYRNVTKSVKLTYIEFLSSHYSTSQYLLFGNYLFKQIFHGLCFSQFSLAEKRLPHYRIFTLFRMDIPGSLWYNQLNQQEAFQVCKFKPWYIVTSGVNSVLRLNKD